MFHRSYRFAASSNTVVDETFDLLAEVSQNKNMETKHYGSNSPYDQYLEQTIESAI